MKFDKILAKVLDLLRSRGRVSYVALKIRFNLDDDCLEALKAEIIEVQQLATDENGKVLVWHDEPGVIIQAQYDLARTYLNLAPLAHTRGDQDTTTTYLSTAYAWFKKLQVPKYVERTEQLAREYGVTLTEIELEELTEDSL